MSKKEKDFDERIIEGFLYTVGFVIGKIFGVVGKYVKEGIAVAKYNKIVLTTYILLGLSIFVSRKMIFITIIVIMVVGIYQYIIDKPIRELKEYFSSIFYEIGLQSNNNVPQYVSGEDINKYVKMVKFYSLIPLSEWNKKRDHLEMYLNTPIVNIEQDSKDNRYIYLSLETETLPHMIEWNDSKTDLNYDVLNIGESTTGIVGMDLNKTPHAFIAGESGSGKSNILKCMIHQSIQKNYDVILIDFKRGVAFSNFDVPIYYEYDETIEVLKSLVDETKHRLDIFRDCGVEQLKDYNKWTTKKLKRIIVFIDEVAELLGTRDKETSKLLYEYIESLARLSRAVGIHLIMGMQRVDSTIINGQIKSNVSYRVCGHFVDKEPSRIMLGNDMASTIEDIKGRFIVKDSKFHEVQCFYYQNTSYKPYKANSNKTRAEVLEYIKQATNEIETPSNDVIEDKQVKQELNIMDFDFSDIKENENIKDIEEIKVVEKDDEIIEVDDDVHNKSKVIELTEEEISNLSTVEILQIQAMLSDSRPEVIRMIKQKGRVASDFAYYGNDVYLKELWGTEYDPRFWTYEKTIKNK